MTPSLPDTGVFTALGTFLVSILPVGIPIIRGQVNRTPEPRQGDFVVMWELRRERIELNLDAYADVVFTASIAGTVMAVADVEFGTVIIGGTLSGTGVAPAVVLAQTSGPDGGVGNYTIDQAQTVSSRTISSGGQQITQATKFVIQCDVHGPNSADNAQSISTLLRDPYGYDSFVAQNPNFGVVPLLTEDPRQIPFLDGEQQVETRYIVEVWLQANPTITVPQQFADTVAVDIFNVDATFPPA